MNDASDPEHTSPAHDRWRDVASMIPNVIDALQEACAARQSGRTQGLTTGIDELDRVTGGFRGGQLIWLASPHGLGLGRMTRHWMLHIAMREAFAVACCTFRSTAEHITQGLTGTLAGVAHHRLQRGLVTAHEMSKIVVAAETLRKLPIFITSGRGLTVEEYAKRVASLGHAVKPADLGLLVIEDIHLFAQDQAATEDFADVIRHLRALARKCNCALLVLSQAPDPAHLDESLPGGLYQRLGLPADAATLVDWAMYLKPRLDLGKGEQSVSDLDIVFGLNHGEGTIRCLWHADGTYAWLGAIHPD